MGAGAGVHAREEAGVASGGCIEKLRNGSYARHAVGDGVVRSQTGPPVGPAAR